MKMKLCKNLNLTLIIGLFLIANFSYGQWSGTGPIETYDEVKIYNKLYVGGSIGIDSYSPVTTPKLIDRDDTRYQCNPGSQSAFYSLKIQQSSNDLTMFAVDNDGTTHINATLKAKEIFVQTNVWADYVFKKDYQLMSLYELENYIQKNNHLPKIPSQEKMIDGGVNVSEMNILMMEKIEELTLYVIQLKKEIDALKTK
ncbi:MAG: hypothetical protein HYU68_09710 [Bacteroidetes bacterium]|nr:hypothetical protein [Bacteroidota bacterium]